MSSSSSSTTTTTTTTINNFNRSTPYLPNPSSSVPPNNHGSKSAPLSVPYVSAPSHSIPHNPGGSNKTAPISNSISSLRHNLPSTTGTHTIRVIIWLGTTYAEGYYVRTMDNHSDLVATIRNHKGIYETDDKRYRFQRSESYPFFIKELYLLNKKHSNKFKLEEPSSLAQQTWLLTSPLVLYPPSVVPTGSSSSSSSSSSSASSTTTTTTSTTLQTSSSSSLSTIPTPSPVSIGSPFHTAITIPNYSSSSTSSSSSTVDLVQRLPSSLLSVLLPFQKDGIKFCIQRSGCALIADEMGCGKTLQATATALYYRNLWPLLVICPAALVLNWKQEILQWAPDSTITVVSTTTSLNKGNLTASWNPRNELRQGGTTSTVSASTGKSSTSSSILSCPPTSSTASTTGRFGKVSTAVKSVPLPPECEKLVTIVSMQRVSKLVKSNDLQSGDFQAIIIDESHNLKSWQTQRTVAIKSIIQGAQMRLLLSGTPAPNRLAELHPQVCMINSLLFPSYDDFAIRYCDRRNSPFGQNAYDDRGESCIEELSCILQYHTMVRRTKRDVLSTLPPKERQVVHVAMNPSSINDIIRQQIEMDKCNATMNSIQHTHLLKGPGEYTENENRHLKYLLQIKQRIMLKMYEIMGIGKAPAVLDHILRYLRPLVGQNFRAVPDHSLGNVTKKQSTGGKVSKSRSSKRLRRHDANDYDNGNNSDENNHDGGATETPLTDPFDLSDASLDVSGGGFFPAEMEENDTAIASNTGNLSSAKNATVIKRSTIIDIHDTDSEEDEPITHHNSSSSKTSGMKDNHPSYSGTSSSTIGLTNTHNSLLHDKIVVFAHHQEVLSYLEKELRSRGIKFVRIDGNATVHQKDERKTLFQTSKDIQIALLSIKASGVGLSFTKASLAIFAELDWTPSNLLQAEDRIHRIGQTASRVGIHYLLCPTPSIDKHYQALLQNKSSFIHELGNSTEAVSSPSSTDSSNTTRSMPISSTKVPLATSIKSPDDAMWNILADKLDTIEKAIQTNTGLLNRRNDTEASENDIDDDDEDDGGSKKRKATDVATSDQGLDGEKVPVAILYEFLNGFSSGSSSGSSMNNSSKTKSPSEQSAVSFFQRGTKSSAVPTSPVNTLLNHFLVRPSASDIIEQGKDNISSSLHTTASVPVMRKTTTDLSSVIVIEDNDQPTPEPVQEDTVIHRDSTVSVPSHHGTSSIASTVLEGISSVTTKASTVVEGLNSVNTGSTELEGGYFPINHGVSANPNPPSVSTTNRSGLSSNVSNNSTHSMVKHSFSEEETGMYRNYSDDYGSIAQSSSSSIVSSATVSTGQSSASSTNYSVNSTSRSEPILGQTTLTTTTIPYNSLSTNTALDVSVEIVSTRYTGTVPLPTNLPTVPTVTNHHPIPPITDEFVFDDNDLADLLDRLDREAEQKQQQQQQQRVNTSALSTSMNRSIISISSSTVSSVSSGIQHTPTPTERRPLYLPYRQGIHVPDRQSLQAIPLPNSPFMINRTTMEMSTAISPHPSTDNGKR